MEKWKRAVVHLECTKHIPVEAYVDRDPNKLPDRSQGTAVLLVNEGLYYLITARHVLLDSQASYPDTIYSKIFPVRSFDQFWNGTAVEMPPLFMNLQAGTDVARRYTFSSAELDLAVISLSAMQQGRAFAQYLLAMGHVPITLEDVAPEPAAEGIEIFTVGFPQTAIHSTFTDVDDFKEGNWLSKDVSLPVFSFGRVAQLHEGLDRFWGDLSAWPGNSGGPVVADGKLVGIVSGQATVASEKYNDTIRIPFASIIKARHITELLAAQHRKDNFVENFSKMMNS